MTNIRKEREDITIATKDIKSIIKEYYEQLYAHKFFFDLFILFIYF